MLAKVLRDTDIHLIPSRAPWQHPLRIHSSLISRMQSINERRLGLSCILRDRRAHSDDWARSGSPNSLSSSVTNSVQLPRIEGSGLAMRFGCHHRRAISERKEAAYETR